MCKPFCATFGKVAQPLLVPKMETDRRNKKIDLMKVMFYPNVNSFV